MARPAKRLSPDSDDGEEAESSQRAAAAKRVKQERVKAERIERDLDDEENGETTEHHSRTASLTPADDYDDDSGGGTINYESLAEEEVLAAYEKSRQELIAQIGTTAEAGIIKSVTLVDFMCHRHLTMDMAGTLNFIVGHNGSGKSAVLTALIIALGGRSKVTGRGSGFKELIRQGQDRAIITVTLRNNGPMAFKPDVYPGQIVIERMLERSGASSYKIKATRDGKILARKKQEMDDIVNHFNIVVDSPATILTQDAARSFLKTHDPQKLYQFFLDSTDLSTLEKKFMKIYEQIETVQSFVDNSKDSLPDLKDRRKELEAKASSAQQAKKQKEKLIKVRHELAWAYVNQKETELNDASQAMTTQADLVRQAEDKLQDTLDALAKLDADVTTMEAEVKELRVARQPLEASIKKAKEGATATQKLYAESVASAQDASDVVGRRRKEVEKYDKEIAVLRAKADAGLGEEQRKLLEQREDFQQRLDGFTKQKPLSEEKERQKLAARDRAQEHEDQLESQFAASAAQTSSIRNRVESLKGQDSNRIGLFGSGIQRVLQEIDRAQWTGPKPLGPLGQYIHLLDDQYKDVMHSIMGDTMCGFSVRNAKDRAQLFTILHRAQEVHGYRVIRNASGQQQRLPLPPVITFGGDIFDFASGDCRSLGETVLSKLRFDNEDALRIFINQSGIERTFVSPTVILANRMIDTLCTATLRVVNIYSADGFRSTGTYNGDGYDLGRQSGPFPTWRGNNLFTKDVAEQLREDAASLEQSREETQSWKDKHQAAIKQRQEAEEELKESRVSLDKVKRAIPLFTTKLQEIEDQLKYQPSDEIEAKEQMRKSAQAEIETQERHIHGFKLEQDNLMEKIRSFQTDQREAEENLERLTPNNERVRSTLSSLTEERAKSQGHRKHWENLIVRHGQNRAAAEQKVATFQAELLEWTEKAKGMTGTDRVLTNKKPDILQQALTAIEKTLKAATLSQGFDIDQVTAQLADVEQQITTVGLDIKECEGLMVAMRHGLSRRRRWWVNARSSTAVRTKTLFTMNMRKRGLDATLEFDHTNSSLKPWVHVVTKADDPTLPNVKATKNLSGGEKSFLTVSLLLALWDSANGPIRCLDEWDVFLDHVNRTTAGNMLIEGAKDTVETQYILITPQDMGGINVSGPDNRTHRMSDPDRRQSTLPYTAVAA